MNALTSAIYTTLTGGTALTSLLAGTASVYYNAAPDDATFPYVVFNYQSNLEENQTPSRMKDAMVYIRGYTDVSSAAAGNIASAIDGLFHAGTLTVTGYENFWTSLSSEVEYFEITPNGERIHNAGGVYRIRLGS